MVHRGVTESQNAELRSAPASAQAPPSLNGPHVLNAQVISRTVTRKSPGVYVVNSVMGGAADPRLVGRADDDLAASLKEYIGLYASFNFAYASSPANAYEIECQIYHALKPPESTRHPTKPASGESECPICGARA